MDPINNIKDTADSVKGIVEAVPVYQDLLQPTAQELGKGLHTVSKLVHVALAPVSAMVWGYEQIKEYTQNSLERKLKNVPDENIITPDLSIAGPTLEAMRYLGHKEDLRDMFANLLATTMDKDTAMKAHPSFVDIIKQLNSDEAKIFKLIDHDQSIPLIKVRLLDLDVNHYTEPLKNFSLLPLHANCDYFELGPSYLDNLERLKLAHISYTSYSTKENAYTDLMNHPDVKYWEEIASDIDRRFEVKVGIIERTDFGKKFYESCVISK